MLPSAWVSLGVEHALQYRINEALGYLAVTIANALFLSMLAVLFVADRLPVAFDRAASLRSGDARPCSTRRASHVIGRRRACGNAVDRPGGTAAVSAAGSQSLKRKSRPGAASDKPAGREVSRRTRLRP